MRVGWQKQQANIKFLNEATQPAPSEAIACPLDRALLLMMV